MEKIEEEQFEELLLDDNKVQKIFVENKESLRDKARRIAKDLQEKYTDLGEILYVIHKNEYWKSWGFLSFEEYALKELNILKRKAYYLRSIFEKICIDLKVPKEQIEQESWAKMQKIATLFDNGVVNQENKDDWIQKSKDMSIAELDTLVKNKQKDIIISEAKKDNKKINVTFKMFPDLLEQYETQKRKYMEKLKIQEDQFNREIFLSDVLLEFNIEHATKLEEIDSLCNRIEQKFDGRYQMVLVDLFKNEIIRNSNLGVKLDCGIQDVLKQLEDKFNIKIVALNKDQNDIIYGKETVEEKIKE